MSSFAANLKGQKFFVVYGFDHAGYYDSSHKPSSVINPSIVSSFDLKGDCYKSLAMNYKKVILLTAVVSHCTTKPDANPLSTGSSAGQETTHSKSAQQLLADTVTQNISNSSLSPDYQFSKEWVLTGKEALNRETVGEEQERISRKKMDPQFWDLVRRFDKNITYDPPQKLEGADAAYLIFHSAGKVYRFPLEAMQEKAASVEDFFREDKK